MIANYFQHNVIMASRAVSQVIGKYPHPQATPAPDDSTRTVKKTALLMQMSNISFTYESEILNAL